MLHKGITFPLLNSCIVPRMISDTTTSFSVLSGPSFYSVSFYLGLSALCLLDVGLYSVDGGLSGPLTSESNDSSSSYVASSIENSTSGLGGGGGGRGEGKGGDGGGGGVMSQTGGADFVGIFTSGTRLCMMVRQQD